MANMYNPSVYIINSPITVTAGQAAPWFGQYGGGIQYILPMSIQELLDSGILSIFKMEGNMTYLELVKKVSNDDELSREIYICCFIHAFVVFAIFVEKRICYN